MVGEKTYEVNFQNLPRGAVLVGGSVLILSLLWWQRAIKAAVLPTGSKSSTHIRQLVLETRMGQKMLVGY